MHSLTRMPEQMRHLLHSSRHFFRYRHHLVFCWSLVLILITQDKGTLSALSRRGPSHICAWHIRRLLAASYWSAHLLLWHLADSLLAVLPPPEDGVLYVIGDGTYKGKTGHKHPLAKKGRIRTGGPYLFGLHIIIVMLHWNSYRIPIDFEIVRKKGTKDYQTPNRLFRQMLDRLKPPVWTTKLMVLADSEFASKDTLCWIKAKGYFFVMSLSRTWKFADDRAVKDLVRHLPRSRYRKSWIQRADGRRRVFWTYRKSACLRHIGHVTMVLSKLRRNDGPKSTSILVTNLPDMKVKQILTIYARRWHIELLIKELKGTTALGQAQVTKQADRVERSVALSLMAYLLLLLATWKQVPIKGSWSAFALKQSLIWQIAKEQWDHTLKRTIQKYEKLPVAA